MKSENTQKFIRQPKVSIGVPVYNGADTISTVLDNILAQTLPAFEIIISDNCSFDETPKICEEYASKFSVIRYYRQKETSDPTRNFRFVLEHARGEFFMWSAHDDTRDPGYIECLTKALIEKPNAVLAFGDVVQYFEGDPLPMPLDFMHGNRSLVGRLYWAATSPLHHLYGVWRTSALMSIEWRHTEWWHDTPLMMAASLLGDFTHVPGVRLHYCYNEHPFFSPMETSTVIQIMRRLSDIYKMIFYTGLAVAKIGGIRLGVTASIFAFVKLVQQTVTYFRYRLFPNPKIDRRKQYSERTWKK